MADGRKVPMRLSDFSVIDSEFNNIRERFDSEMQKMEDEMAKFRQELLNRESSVFSRTSTSSHMASQSSRDFQSWTEDAKNRLKDFPSSGDLESQILGATNGLQSSSTFHSSSTSTTSSSNMPSLGDTPFGRGDSKTWLDTLNSPLIQSDEKEGKMLKLRFDVNQYAPEEIVVKTVDNKLQVHAKHEEKSDNRSVYREYNREFLLPNGTNPELIKSSLSKDGVLTVEAPLPALPAPDEKLISVTHK